MTVCGSALRHAALPREPHGHCSSLFAGDVGIDGNLEFVTAEGLATGRLMAVQVKSGRSFFSHPTTHGWKCYPEEKHRKRPPELALLRRTGNHRCVDGPAQGGTAGELAFEADYIAKDCAR